MVTKVNSEREVQQLLDEKGQLRLTTPLNIFIGGQILDRGITIENLIGFYYGRRPNKFQQDTVLQHSRMFGNRSLEDLAVTRFYTAYVIYEAMKRIDEFDTALREAFEREAQEAGVVFIHADPTNKIIPCSPNKILLSTTTTLKPNKRILPFGFQTLAKTNMKPFLEKLDKVIDSFPRFKNEPDLHLIDVSTAILIINEIYETLEFEEGFQWDLKAFLASMEYLSRNTDNEAHKGKIWCLARRGRNISRTLRDGTFSKQPDSPETDQTVARDYAIDIPMLILTRQNGLKEEQGWKGTPFWWPVLIVPQNSKTVVFASDLVEAQ